jgi:hypothetical protein
MIDRQTKQFMSYNLTKTQTYTHIVTNWWRSLSISRTPTVVTAVAAVIAVVTVVAAVVTVVATVAAVVIVRAASVENEVAAGSPLDYRELLEPIRQPVDPEGETIHT